MVEKIIFSNTGRSYFPVYTDSARNFILARFLDDDIGADLTNSWLYFIETYEEKNEAYGNCVQAMKLPEHNDSENTIIIMRYLFNETYECNYSAKFLAHIIKAWDKQVQIEHPFLELLIDWEQETFEFKPLEHWIDPHKEDIETRAQVVINKFLGRVEEWKKQNPDD